MNELAAQTFDSYDIQKLLELLPHPGVLYLFQNQTPASAADDRR